MMRRQGTLTLKRAPNEEGAALDRQPLSIASIVDRLDLDSFDAALTQRWTASLEASVQAWRDRARRRYMEGRHNG
jgi:sulfite reductase beta subunit-like hemoprotein